MNARTYENTWTVLAAATLFTLALGMTPQMSAAEKLSNKQVQQLIANAKEPQDHLRIAKYYKDEAAKFEEDAKDHEAMRESYRKAQPAPHNMASPTQTVAHCDVLIKDLREAAEQDNQLAAEHEQMAKDAAAKPTK